MTRQVDESRSESLENVETTRRALTSDEEDAQAYALDAASALVDELRRLRQERDVPQSRVAFLMRTDQGAVAKLENHVHDPGLGKVMRYMSAVGLDPMILVDAVTAQSRENDEGRDQVLGAGDASPISPADVLLTRIVRDSTFRQVSALVPEVTLLVDGILARVVEPAGLVESLDVNEMLGNEWDDAEVFEGFRCFAGRGAESIDLDEEAYSRHEENLNA